MEVWDLQGLWVGQGEGPYSRAHRGVGAWGRPGAAKALCTVGSQGREHLAQPWVTVTLTVRAGQAGHRWPCP